MSEHIVIAVIFSVAPTLTAAATLVAQLRQGRKHKNHEAISVSTNNQVIELAQMMKNGNEPEKF